MLLAVYIVFCFELGVLLLILPWVALWGRNYFAGEYGWVASVARNYFVRGAITGFGLADIYLALSEAWRLREPLGLVQPAPPRACAGDDARPAARKPPREQP